MQQLIRKLLLIGYTISVAVGICPNAWVRYDSSCYLFKDSFESWQGAQTYCEGLASHLVEPNTARENRFIQETLRTMHHHSPTTAYFWMGGSTISAGHSWVWVHSDTSITYTDWAPGEPTYGNSAGNCMAFFGHQNFLWDDGTCDAKENFICEKEMGDNEEIVGR